jgi:hypothetical protein
VRSIVDDGGGVGEVVDASKLYYLEKGTRPEDGLKFFEIDCEREVEVSKLRDRGESIKDGLWETERSADLRRSGRRMGDKQSRGCRGNDAACEKQVSANVRMRTERSNTRLEGVGSRRQKLHDPT